jgi:ribonuclease P protein component
MRFRPEQHLRRAADFQRVRAEGRRVDGGAFTLWHAPRPADTGKAPAPARAGFVASRAAVGGAVARNRARRRLREAFRRQQPLAPAGRDLILVARAAAGRMDFVELECRLAEACRKISMPAT